MALKIRNIIFNMVTAIIVGLLLLMAVYLIPTNKIDENVCKSATIIQNEGMHYRAFDWCSSILDNFTDSLMMLEAANNTDNSLLVKALKVNRGDYYQTSEGPTETLIRHYINGEEFELVNSYCRYWHGYLIFLKPLFYLFTYSTIRIINLIIQLLLTLAISIVMYKRNLKQYIIPYLISYLMMMPYILGLSLQYSSCFYIYSVSVLIILLISKNILIKYDYLLFLNIGIALAYFDYLTYPIVTLCIPMIFYLLLRDDLSEKDKIMKFFILCLCWTIGYSIMWSSKWILSDLFTEEEIIEDAIKAIANRTSNVEDGIVYTPINSVITNYSMFIFTPFKYLMFGYIFIELFIYIKKVINDKINIFNISLLIYVLMAILPIIWLSLTVNHSMTHGYLFVNKVCVVSFMAIMFYLASFNKKENI